VRQIVTKKTGLYFHRQHLLVSVGIFSLLTVIVLPFFTTQIDAQTLVAVNNTEAISTDSDTAADKVITASHPYISPNPVGPAGRVNIKANYTNNEIGIESVRLDIQGPNVGSTDPQLAPTTISSSPMLLIFGTAENGIWSTNFTFPKYIPDGSYLYSLKITDKIGHVTRAGPYSSIILDRIKPDPAETSIVSAVDDKGRTLNNGSITYSPNITFTFQGTDKSGVIQSFQCNLDDIVVHSEHGHGDEQDEAPSTYSSCFNLDKVGIEAMGNYTYVDLGAGNHTFKVRALDNEYDLDTSPSSFSWVILPPPVSANPPSPTTIR
jgi:type II secretory pathway pseudopilin PulG